MSVWDKPCDASFLHHDWSTLEKGTKISLVLDVLIHTTEMLVGITIPGNQRVRVIGAVDAKVRGCRRLTLFDVIFDSTQDQVDLLLTDQTEVIAHGLRPSEDLFRCVELCAGLACSSVGLSAAGFRHVCSVEWRAPLVELHRLCNPGVPVIHGDIADLACIRDVLRRIEPPFTLMTGFSCQPYSSGGSQGRSCDDRSSTVPATIKACHLCQCPLLILECVTQARSNQFVRSCLPSVVRTAWLPPSRSDLEVGGCLVLQALPVVGCGVAPSSWSHVNPRLAEESHLVHPRHHAFCQDLVPC